MGNKNILTLNEKKILAQLLIYQRSDVEKEYKLTLNLIIKVIKILGEKTLGNLLDNNNKNCWINMDSVDNKKISCINFYINNKKIALHRLMYINFTDSLDKNSYLKHTCNNKNCYNIYHLEKAIHNDNEIQHQEVTRIAVNNNYDKIIINLND